MIFHTNPQQCLENLAQLETDGGRWEYLEQEERLTRKEPEMPTGDCAVVALVHASFNQPTGQSYREAKSSLWMSTRPWMHKMRMMGESRRDFLYRRFKQWFRSPNADPIHGTSSHAMGSSLEILGYRHIYPNDDNNWYCICDKQCSYVLDVQIPGNHTMTVHEGVAYTTAPFEPARTTVGNVHWLNPRKTRAFKAAREYKEAEVAWFRDWMDSGMTKSLDWNSRPKLQD